MCANTDSTAILIIPGFDTESCCPFKLPLKTLLILVESSKAKKVRFLPYEQLSCISSANLSYSNIFSLEDALSELLSSSLKRWIL